MTYRAQDYAAAIYDLIMKKPDQRQKIARSLWRVLTKRQQTKIWQKIINDVKFLEDRKNPVVTVETPCSLSTHTKQQIMKLCRQSIGQEINEFQEIIRPELIGGIMGTTRTHQFDWSIAKQLDQLI